MNHEHPSQSLGPNAPISGFFGRYRFLSNFYPSEILYAPNGDITSENARVWPTVEHAYQASKTFDPDWQLAVHFAKTPAQAKAIGHAISKRPDLLRPDWKLISLDVMSELLILKYQHPHLREWLPDTGTRKLIEMNNWGDTFWGVCRGIGENWLGRLTMVVRELVR